jgi:hypothetical protein
MAMETLPSLSSELVSLPKILALDQRQAKEEEKTTVELK